MKKIIFLSHLSLVDKLLKKSDNNCGCPCRSYYVTKCDLDLKENCDVNKPSAGYGVSNCAWACWPSMGPGSSIT